MRLDPNKMESDEQPKLGPSKQSALDHFGRVDQKLHALATHHLPDIDLPASQPPENRAAVLMRLIIGQQISVKATNSIWQRLQPKLFSTDKQPANPEIETLVANGASTAKAKSLLALSRALTDGQLDMTVLDDWTDEQVIDHLVQHPGIGPWTAEMFLIRGLGRLDVFSLGDLGLRVALSRLHSLPAEISQLEPLAQTYSPHRTLAALVCWRSLDNGDLYAEKIYKKQTKA